MSSSTPCFSRVPKPTVTSASETDEWRERDLEGGFLNYYSSSSSIAKAATHYRPEIDGLRAIAVIPVILFHSGVGVFSGGFVGVDVFFVISGFLIGGMIHSETKTSSFSIAHFYERRIKRIIPALTVVIFATLIASYLLFLPGQLINLGKATIATALFGSNIFFWTQSGYFNAPADLPLLHTWSLAVEEQFYIAFPLLMVLLARRPRLLVPTLLVLALGSLTLSIYGTRVSPGATFYLLPTRAWELLAGSLLAVIPVPQVRGLQEVASIVGLGLIGIGIFSFNQSTHFPGAAAMIPVAGAMLSIYGGGQTLGGRALASNLLVWIGLISYSLYLWHWPILVLAKQLTASSDLPPTSIVVCMALTLALSVIAWRVIERPFRRSKIKQYTLFLRTGAVLAAGVVLGFLPVIAGGFSFRFNERALNFAGAKFSPRGEKCLAQAAKDATSFCAIGSDNPSFVLWGDSHAGALLPAVEYAASVRNRSGIFAGFNACPPLFIAPSTLPGRDGDNCLKRNRAVSEKIAKDGAIQVVILAAFWSSSSYEISEGSLREVLDAMGGKRVFLLADVPTPGFAVPLTLALREGSNTLPPPIFPTRDIPALRAALEYPNVTMIPLAPALCDNGSCPPERNGHALYADGNHISDYASREIMGPYLLKTLKLF